MLRLIAVLLFVSAVLLPEKMCADAFNCTNLTRPILCPKSHPYVYNITDEYGGLLHTDASVCIGNSCPTCLKGPEWEALLAELGKGRVNRTVIPRMFIGNWASTELIHTVATILLQDTMGFHVNNFNVGSFYLEEVVCCEQGPHEINFLLESWQSTEAHADVTTMSNGYNGQENLYVPKHTLKKYPMATAFNSYKFLPEYKDMVGRAFSTPCAVMRMNQSLPCEDSNYDCNTPPVPGYWEGTELVCQQGRYVPPQCQGENAKYCQEILMITADWTQGFWELQVKYNKLNFTLAYLGIQNWVEVLLNKTAAGEDFIFLAGAPDPIIAKLGAEPIMFKPYTQECPHWDALSYLKTNQSPPSGYFRSDCNYPMMPLTKIIRTDRLRDTDADLRNFFESVMLLDNQVLEIMKDLELGGGSKNVYDSACSWVKNNPNVWKSWIANTPASTHPPHPPITHTTYTLSAGAIAGIVLGLVGGVLVLGAAQYLWKYTENSRRLAKLLNNDKVATELAESVASMDFEAVSYLDEIKEPTRIQSAFIKIVSVLKLLRPYLPQHLLAKQIDNEDDQGAVEAAAPQPPSRASSVASSGQSTPKAKDGGDPEAPAIMPLVPDGGPMPVVPERKVSLEQPRKRSLALSVTSHLVEKVVTVVAVRCAVVTDVALMQKFISITVQAVRSTHGLCYSFRAGILLATWTRGGTMTRPNVQAVKAAMAAMETLQKEEIEATSGIDASKCLTGNVGTQDTLMFNELHGDAVHTAMTLCNLAKELDTNVLLTEAVRKDCTHSLISRLAGYKRAQSDTLALPTRSPSDVPLYQALQLRTSEKENRDMADEWMYVMQEEEKIIDSHKVFENGIKLLFEGKKDEAYAVLEQVLAKDATDLVAKKYLSFGDAVHQLENGNPLMAYSSAMDLIQCYRLYHEGKYEEAKETLEKCAVKDHHYDRLMAAIEAGAASGRSPV